MSKMTAYLDKTQTKEVAALSRTFIERTCRQAQVTRSRRNAENLLLFIEEVRNQGRIPFRCVASTG